MRKLLLTPNFLRPPDGPEGMFADLAPPAAAAPGKPVSTARTLQPRPPIITSHHIASFRAGKHQAHAPAQSPASDTQPFPGTLHEAQNQV